MQIIDSEHYSFHNEAVRTVFGGAGGVTARRSGFHFKKYNKPISAEEAILIALISGSDVLQAEAVNISMEQLQEIKKKMIGGKA